MHRYILIGISYASVQNSPLSTGSSDMCPLG